MSAPSGEDAARALLAERTPDETQSKTRQNTTILFSPEAIDAIREAEQLIERANTWAEQLLDLRADLGELMDERTLYARRALVREMRETFYSNLVRLITMAQGFDGHELHFFRDGEACLYWRHPKSGYCGGLILHRNLRYSKSGEPILIGTWSVHT
jgi:hypothetical protein